MKDLSFFLLKNSLGAKMRKGFRNTFCNDDGSTSTLDQKNSMASSPYTNPHHHHHHHHHHRQPNPTITSEMRSPPPPPPTLEDMLLKLELEEENARKAKLKDYNNGTLMRGRMSCVNNSDILMSARNALNQYPRFSLDGKDAMYRSSFRGGNRMVEGRRSICCEYALRRRRVLDHGEYLCLPSKLAGESVVWCKPGVVAKLMGLEAVPVPVNRREKKFVSRTILKRQNLRRAERHELERKLAMDNVDDNINNIIDNDIECGRFVDRERILASSSTTSNKTAPTNSSIVNPVAVALQHEDVHGRRGGGGGGGGWPTQRFL